MITVREADQIIKNVTHRISFTEVEEIEIEKATGRILAENIFADTDFPPFHRVAMDGIAISSHAWLEGRREFKIQELQRAGEPPKELLHPHHAIEIMTGAILPKNCDMVIRYEDLNVNEKVVAIKNDILFKHFLNIHCQGEDKKKGEKILSQGKILGPTEIQIAASVGKNKLAVKKIPAISLISTGDELVSIDSMPLSHQIRMSNPYLIQSAFANLNSNIKFHHVHARDCEDELKSAITHELQKSKICVITGGVSMGAFDLVPKILKELGCQIHFHKISQRPGKPLLFASGREGQIIFGLPGNPMSTLVCMTRYVLPTVQNILGVSYEPIDVEMSESCSSSAFTLLKPVKIKFFAGKVLALPISHHGSGDMISIVDADGVVEVEGQSHKKIFPFYSWRGHLHCNS